MFFDLNQLEANHFQGKTFDICVCGAGVAGITLAIQLSRKFSVILLEGGGFQYSKDSQAIYKGKNSGLEYFDLDITRLRFFGGSSNHWGGRCRPLDDCDFKKREDVEFSGWPINRADLDPYLEESKSILDITEQTTLLADTTKGPPFSDGKDFQEINFWTSRPPTNFGHKYRAHISNSTKIHCYLNANVTDIHLHNNSDRVDYVVAQNYSGRAFEVSAKSFILAFGGIEIPRIMLNCNRQEPAGLGNKYGFVGRFFTEHLHFKVGELILEDGVDLGPKKRFIAPTYEFMRRENILNFGLQVKQRIHSKTSFKKKLRQIICSS